MSAQSSLTSSGLPSPPRTPPKSPQNPYFKGAKFTAKRHEPPKTYEMGYGDGHHRPVPEVDQGSSQLAWCLAHPPAPGITHEADEQYIDIAEVIRVGEDCGAQVVLTADGLIAKIYDPLYYNFHDKDGWDEYINVTNYADRDYITEVTAYSELIATPLHGSIAPRYYGSWTLSIPLHSDSEKEVREVRLILLEYVSGKAMLDVDPFTLNEHERENIMIKLIEADVDLRFSGVRHDDLEPRNVILSMPESSTSFDDRKLRLCIIDFACCGISKDKGREGPNPLFRNPLYYWVGQSWWSDLGWLLPKEKALEWMWTNWGDGGKEGKYVVVERDPDNKFGEPKWPNGI